MVTRPHRRRLHWTWSLEQTRPAQTPKEGRAEGAGGVALGVAAALAAVAAVAAVILASQSRVLMRVARVAIMRKVH